MADLGIPLLPTEEVALFVIIADCPSAEMTPPPEVEDDDDVAVKCASPEGTGVAGALTLPRDDPSPLRHQVSSSKTFSKQS